MKEMTLKELNELSMIWKKSRILFTGIELNIFDFLKKPISSIELSQKLDISRRYLDRFLNSLVAIGVLKKDKNLFQNTPMANKYLNRKSENYLKGLKHINNMYHYWCQLTRVIKEGKPATKFQDIRHPENWIENFIEGMQQFSSEKSTKIVELIDTSRIKNFLDLGGGSGEYARALLKKDKKLKGTVFDIPEAIKIAKKYTENSEVANRINFLEGDFFKDPIGNNYDMVFISNILHAFSLKECEILFNKVYKSLNEGGLLVIHEHFIDESRTEPEYMALFSINMLVHTEDGDTYTEKEITEILEKSNFRKLKVVETGFNSHILTAQKV